MCALIPRVMHIYLPIYVMNERCPVTAHEYLYIDCDQSAPYRRKQVGLEKLTNFTNRAKDKIYPVNSNHSPIHASPAHTFRK